VSGSNLFVNGRQILRDELLPSGKSISATGYTCTAEQVRVRRVHDASCHGIFVAPNSNERF
jgi:hypothetical protein